MGSRLRTLTEDLRAGFWFIPATMCVAAAVLAYGLVELDLMLAGANLEAISWFFIESADGARAALSTIASSTITVAGTVFSLTMVALTLASNQFGPRLIRAFMRDIATQLVLGTFVATYLYCILLLRVVRSVQEVEFVPNLAVLTAVVLAVVNVGVLIFFFHHVAMAIQVPNLIAAIGNQLKATIVRLYPPRVADAAEHEALWRLAAAERRRVHDEGAPVAAGRSGYVVLVDEDALLGLASAHDRLICLEARPGSFMVQGAPLAIVAPPASEELADALRGAIVIRHQRMQLQDFEAYILQLVEIASRALSPAFNDPFTAIACIDRLGEAILLLDDRELPPPYRVDAAGEVRLLLEGFTFSAAVASAFSMIRQYARGHTVVLVRLLDTLAEVAAQTERADRRGVLRRHADMVLRAAEESLPEERDRQEVARRHTALLRELGE